MTEILGKVTTASWEIPRGADVSLRIDVPALWLAEGRMIEIELPRNLCCVRCCGGGCGTCGNSGAITLRSRTELPELVQVVLPLPSITEASVPCPRPAANGASTLSSESASGKHPKHGKAIAIRIPECGGLPDASKGEVFRGFLLLEVGAANEASPNVRTLDEDAIDSSKMLRAAVRATGKAATDSDYKAVLLPRHSRAPKEGDKEAEQPPESRIAKAGSTAPPHDQGAPRFKPETRLADLKESGTRQLPAARAHRLSAAHGAYIVIALLTVLAILASFFL